MKVKVSKKEVAQNYSIILKVGYCSMQTLLNYKNAFAYSCGVYGWSCDYYEINNVCISTGYSPIGQSVDNAIVRIYEQRAQLLNSDYTLCYKDREAQVNSLLTELISLLTTKAI